MTFFIPNNLCLFPPPCNGLIRRGGSVLLALVSSLTYLLTIDGGNCLGLCLCDPISYHWFLPIVIKLFRSLVGTVGYVGTKVLNAFLFVLDYLEKFPYGATTFSFDMK